MRTCWCGGTVGQRSPGDGKGFGCLDSIYHNWSATGKPDKIRKLYIAGPMSGRQDNNYPSFHEAAKRLREAGYQVISPAEFGAEGGHYTDLIREDIRGMLDCEGIATLEEWWESVGARNEVNNGGLLKMPVRSVNEWLARAEEELSDGHVIKGRVLPGDAAQ